MSLELSDFNFKEKIKEQRALFLDAFPEQVGKSGSSLEHYNWKFRQLPAEVPSYEYAAYFEDNLVGYYAALPFAYKMGGSSRRAGMVCDVMTHSLARGKGVFTHLGRHSLKSLKDKGIEFVIGYPIRPEVIPGHLKVGWKIAFKLPIYIKVLKADSILQKKKLSFLAPLANGGLAAYKHLMNLFVSRSERYSLNWLSLQELNTLKEYELFYKTWSLQHANHLIKNSSFYSWRLSAPKTHYEILLGWQESTLVSVTVLRTINILDNIPILAIVDMMILDGHEQSLSLIFDALENNARKNNLEMIACMTTQHVAAKLKFFRHSFINSRIAFQVIVNPLSEELSFEDLCKEENWHLMWIDADTV